MVFETSNTEQLRIAPNGYVGIGTNNPQSKLDLVGSLTLNGTALTATATVLNGLDARVTTEKNRVDAILNLSAAELDTFKEIEDAYKAADSSITTTVTNLQSSHNSDIATVTAATALNTLKVGITSGQTSAITVNTTKVGITNGQVSSITINTAKVGITSGQTLSITANTAKTGITSGQTSAITTNTAKTGITGGQASAITANTAKTGITSGQASEIIANTAKVTYDGASQVATNVTNIALKANQSTTYTKTEADALNATQNTAIGLNTSKNSFPTASNTLLHTTHADLHTTHTNALATHTTQIATKLNTTGNQTMSGKMYFGNEGGNGVTSYNSNTDDLVILNHNDVGITIGAPEGKIGSLTFCDQNKADRSQLRAYSTVRDSRNIGMHMFANQADTEVPSMSICDQVIGINNAQPTYSLDVIGSCRISGNIGFFNTTPVSQHSTYGLQGGATQNTGGSILVGSTFTANTGSTGYTISDVIKCLKDVGLLAP